MKVKISYSNPLEKLKEATARWCVLRDEYGATVDAVCSCCGAHGNPGWKYCPECRTPMDVKEGADEATEEA